MKKVIVTALLCSILLNIFTGCTVSEAGNENGDIIIAGQETDFEADKETEPEEDFIDTEKTPVIPSTNVTEVVYEEAMPYFDNRIVVKQAGRYGIVDNLGNIVMPITQTNEISPLTMDVVEFEENKKYGLLALNGEIIAPAIYDYVRVLSEDFVRMTVFNENVYSEECPYGCESSKKDGYYLCPYDNINRFYSAKHDLDIEIVGWLHSVIVGQNFFVIDYSTRERNNIKKIITFDGEMIDIAEFDPYTHYETDASGYGLAYEWFEATIYKTSDDNEYIVAQKHLIDVNGNIMVDLATEENYSNISEESHFVFDINKDYYSSDEIIISQKIKSDDGGWKYNHYVYNLVTHKKEKIESLDSNTLVNGMMTNGFYEISTLPEGTYYCYFGLMNDEYEVIMQPIYDDVEDYVNGYFPIKLNDYWGYVDEKGNLTTPPIISEEDLKLTNEYFTYRWNVNGGSLINPQTGEPLPYKKTNLKECYDSPREMLYKLYKTKENGIYEAVLTDESTGEEYKSFVTWDGPIVAHKFPVTDINVSCDGKVAVYNQGAVYTIVELF